MYSYADITMNESQDRKFMSSISLQSSFFLTLKVIVHSLTSVEVKKREEKAKWVFFSFKGSLPARKIEVGPLLPPIIEILDAPLDSE